MKSDKTERNTKTAFNKTEKIFSLQSYDAGLDCWLILKFCIGKGGNLMTSLFHKEREKQARKNISTRDAAGCARHLKICWKIAAKTPLQWIITIGTIKIIAAITTVGR